MTGTLQLKFEINLLDDGSVVTRDGVWLGEWGTYESDAFYEFTPEGASEPLFMNPYRGALCAAIEQWNSQNEAL